MNRPKEKGSFWYYFFCKIGFELPPQYKDIKISFVLMSFIKDYKNNFLAQLAKRSFFLGSTLSLHWTRQFFHRLRGCTIGKNTRIAEDCIIGLYHAEKITIEDNVAIAAGCILLEHKRDISLLRYGGSIMKCNYLVQPILLKKGCFIGVGSIIMPGVTVGEGSIVSPGSVVAKKVAPYTIVQGNPAKEIFKIPKTDENIT